MSVNLEGSRRLTTLVVAVLRFGQILAASLVTDRLDSLAHECWCESAGPTQWVQQVGVSVSTQGGAPTLTLCELQVETHRVPTCRAGRLRVAPLRTMLFHL